MHYYMKDSEISFYREIYLTFSGVAKSFQTYLVMGTFLVECLRVFLSSIVHTALDISHLNRINLLALE